MSRIQNLKNRLAKGDKIILDGATGTELQRRGVEVKLPLWSASALITSPDVVQEVHKDYIRAGADIITTNTFRTDRHSLEKGGLGEKTEELNKLAVILAKNARKGTGKTDVVIAGGLSPLEDCYKPDCVPSEKELLDIHRENAKYLAEAGVDLLFVETMNSISESKIALEVSKETGLDVAISFVCSKDGNLLSGESIENAVKAIAPFDPIAIFTNCQQSHIIGSSLKRLLQATDIPIGVYANGEGHPDDEDGWGFCEGVTARKYLKCAEQWLAEGASIIGGCCGTSPEYIGLINKYLSK